MAWEYLYAATTFYFLTQTAGLSISENADVQCGIPLTPPISLQPLRQLMVGKRIVGGKPAFHGSWPWMAMLKRNGEVKCGGSILNEHYIITAAHCVNNETDLNLDVWKVYLGKHHKLKDDVGEVVRPIRWKAVILHHDFDRSTLQNDIALLYIEEPIHYTDYIRPICLPGGNQDQTTCFTTGWGETKGTINSNVLKEVQLEQWYPYKCRQHLITSGRYSGRWRISRSRRFRIRKAPVKYFCAGKKDADACYGDSGGPYSCKSGDQWYLKGIVSSGADCAQPGWPGIYINVPAYVNWIRTMTSSVP